MADLPSRLDLFSIGRDYVTGRAERVDPAMVDVEGSDVNVFVGAASFIGQELIRQLAERFAAHTLDGAEREDLDRLLYDKYGVEMLRKDASPAIVPVRFFRPTAAAGIGSIPAGTKILSLTGVEYVTETTAVFDVATTEVEVDGRATQAGKEYQVGRNQLRRFARPSEIFDATIEVTNDEPATGGEPREEDDVYRERGRDFWLTARRGTLSAIEFGARTVDGVVSASAVERLDGNGRPARIVTLHIADSSGVASRVLGRRVDSRLLEYRAAGIFVETTTGLPQLITIRLRLRFVGGVDTSVLGEQIRAAVFEYVNSLGVNEPLLRSQLGAVLSRFYSDGLRPDDGTIVEPVGDLEPTAGYTLRTRLESVILV